MRANREGGAGLAWLEQFKQHVRLRRKLAHSPLAALRLRARQLRAAATGVDRARFRRETPLVCVVTGLQNSGTTLLSQLLNAHPRVAAGFELGALLRDVVDFDAAEPFYGLLTKDDGLGWALTESDRAGLLEAVDHYELYWRLNLAKGKAHRDPDVRRAFAEAGLIFDKTPLYVFRLAHYMSRIDRPFVMSFKTPGEALASARKRRQDLAQLFFRYGRALIQIDRALDRYPDRLTIVSYRSLTTETGRVMDAVQRAIGLEPPMELTLAAFNARMGHAPGSTTGIRNDSIRYGGPPETLTVAEEAYLSDLRHRHGARLERIEAHAI